MILLGNLLGMVIALSPMDSDDEKQLWNAAREGDLEQVTQLLDSGVDVNASTPYGATALTYACDRGHVEMAQLLCERGADPNARDTFYHATPLTWAMMESNKPIIEILLEHGAETDDALQMAIAQSNLELALLVLDAGRLTDEAVIVGRRLAQARRLESLLERLNQIETDPSLDPPEIERSELVKLEGTYSGDGVRYQVSAGQGFIYLALPSRRRLACIPVTDTNFSYMETKLAFQLEGEKASRLTVDDGSNVYELVRIDPDEADEFEVPARPPRPLILSEAATPEDLLVSSSNWPSFRGNQARGVGEGQKAPRIWDAVHGTNLAWNTPIPGLGLSCPVVWGDSVFVTTAISTLDDAGLRIGNYGDVDSVEDESEHEFVVYCLDKHTGEVKWNRTAHVGIPHVKRHLKSSHANPTIACNGRFVIASFASEGVFCYDMFGNLVWSRDLGLLDSGWFYDPSYQWGFGSSPIIYEDRVILQCDRQDESFLVSLDIRDGQDQWRVLRDEIPSWSSPTVCATPEGPIVVTVGTKSARAYEIKDGALRWSIDGFSEIVVPTPFMAHDLIYLASGYRPIQPLIAIRTDASGNLSEDNAANSEEPATLELDDQVVNGEPEVASDPVAWKRNRGGPYMPTPIVYGDYLYTCANNGIIGCYDAKTGEEIYRNRLSVDGVQSFVASPVASDGMIYLTSEQGIVVVLRAGPNFEVVAANRLGQSCLSTPAISEQHLFFRCEHGLIAITNQQAPRP